MRRRRRRRRRSTTHKNTPAPVTTLPLNGYFGLCGRSWVSCGSQQKLLSHLLSNSPSHYLCESLLHKSFNFSYPPLLGYFVFLSSLTSLSPSSALHLPVFTHKETLAFFLTVKATFPPLLLPVFSFPSNFVLSSLYPRLTPFRLLVLLFTSLPTSTPLFCTLRFLVSASSRP